MISFIEHTHTKNFHLDVCMPIGIELFHIFQLDKNLMLGESHEEEDEEELKEHDIQFHQFLKKGKHFHLDQNVKNHLYNEKRKTISKRTMKTISICIRHLNLEENRIQAS